jgi:CheY-like chemotaxis protein
MDKRLKILVVDDNDLDFERIQRSLKRMNLPNKLFRAKDGFMALDLLRGNERCIEKPYIILLDLNMPKMSGLEFLQEIRNDDKLKSSIVYILSTSDRKQDIDESYKYNIAGYFVKPLDYDSLSTLSQYLDKTKLPGD